MRCDGHRVLLVAIGGVTSPEHVVTRHGGARLAGSGQRVMEAQLTL